MTNQNSKRFIITVDDFGYNHSANQLIFGAIEQGVVDQTSTMVNMVGSKEALDHIAMSSRGVERQSNLKNKSQISNFKFQIKSKNLNLNYHSVKFGLHLNLTEGTPLCHPKTIPSLVDKNGNFFGWPGLIKRAIIGQLRSQDVEKEARAQIEKLQTAIKPIPFLNSHHHIHLWPSIAKIVLPLCKEYKIEQVRWPRKIWWRSFLTKKGFKVLTIQGLAALQGANRQLQSRPYFFDLDWLSPTQNVDEQFMATIPERSEFACHPFRGVNDDSTLKFLIDNLKTHA